ncbi:hypothetical protein PINS_up016418 [Pythium insidiosum]|nr:hypothetical protein PINS_up016418 [Pythium insidiosum]
MVAALEMRVEELRLQGAQTQKLVHQQNDEMRRMLQELREVIVRKGPAPEPVFASPGDPIRHPRVRDLSLCQ